MSIKPRLGHLAVMYKLLSSGSEDISSATGTQTKQILKLCYALAKKGQRGTNSIYTPTLSIPLLLHSTVSYLHS